MFEFFKMCLLAIFPICILLIILLLILDREEKIRTQINIYVCEKIPLTP